MNKLIKIDKLNNGNSIPVSFQTELSLPPEYFVVDNLTNVDFQGNITFINNLYNLKGVLTGEFKLLCGFCTEPVSYPYKIEIEEFFTNLSDVNNEDSDYIYFKGFEINIMPTILTNVILNIPMSVLCSEDCKGLCHYCGTNLNNSSCNCEKPIDPRFDLLNSFFDNKEEV